MTNYVSSLSELSNIAKGALAVTEQLKAKSSIMWMLGPFMFSRDTMAPQEITTSTEYKWATQPRIGRNNATQFIGRENHIKTIEGYIYPDQMGSENSIVLLKLLAEQGDPQILVDGRGFVYGRWVVESVEETANYFHKNGKPRKIEFSVSLKEYGEDENEGGLF